MRMLNMSEDKLDGGGMIQHLVVESDTEQNLLAAIKLAMGGLFNTKLEWYFEKDNELSFYSCNQPAGSKKLLAPMDAEAITPQIVAWIMSDERWTGKFSPEEPDCDGSVYRGWRLTVRVVNYWARFTISPVYVEYGK